MTFGTPQRSMATKFIPIKAGGHHIFRSQAFDHGIPKTIETKGRNAKRIIEIHR